LFGLITGAAGGKLGNALLKRLLARPQFAALGRRLLAEAISDLVSGRVSSLLHTTARGMFDQLRGRERLTVEQFLDRLVEQLLDPKTYVLDAIMGRAGRLAHRAQSTGGRAAPRSHEDATPLFKHEAAPGARAPEPAVIAKAGPIEQPTATASEAAPTVKSTESVVKASPERPTPASVASETGPSAAAREPVTPETSGTAEPKPTTPESATTGPAEASEPKGADPAHAGDAPGLTRSQAAAAKGVITKLTAGDNLLGMIWESVGNPGEKAALTKSNSRGLFNNQRKRFWGAVADNPAARAKFESMGCKFGKRGTAPVLTLPSGEKLQMTLDHVTERQSAPGRALDASNLQISPRRENTVLLRQLHDQDPFQNPRAHGGETRGSLPVEKHSDFSRASDFAIEEYE
jgi:hypothetical protein